MSGDFNQGATSLTTGGLITLAVPISHHLDFQTQHASARRMLFSDDGQVDVSQLGTRLTKAIAYTGWTELESLDADVFASYYSQLRTDCGMFGFWLVDFDHIETEFKADGLCPPGLGRLVFKTMGANLLELVVRTLPPRFHEIHAQVNLIRSGCRNGFDLLWRIGTMVCPVWNVSEPPTKPGWADDIWRFAAKWKLWRNLCRHQGSPVGQYELSRQFLIGLCRVPMFRSAADSRLVWLTQTPPVDPGDGTAATEWPVLPGWTVDELATELSQGVGTMTDGMDLPTPRHAPQVHRLDGHAPPPGTAGTPPITCPRVNRFDGDAQDQDSRYGGDRPRNRHRDGDEGDRSRNRRLPRPNARRARLRKQPQHRHACDACGKFGHPAERCIFLAMYLYVKRYATNGDNKTTVDQCLQNWVERNREWLGDEPDKRMAAAVTTARRLTVESDHQDHDLVTGTDWDYFDDGFDGTDDGLCFDADGNVVLPDPSS